MRCFAYRLNIADAFKWGSTQIKVTFSAFGFCLFFILSVEPIDAQHKISIPDSLIYSPAVNIYDSTRVIFRNAKEEFLDLYITNFKLTQINSSTAIDRVSKKTIPIAFDPFSSDLQAVLNQQVPMGQAMQEIIINKAEYTIIRNGVELPAAPFQKIIEERNVLEIDFLWTVNCYRLAIPNLQAGDLVKTEISYTIRYAFNWYLLTAYRFYLDDYFPTLRKTFVIGHNENLLNIYRGQPKSYTFKDRRTVYKVWNRTNAPGALFEPNSRPSQNIPWFEITVKSDSRRFWHRYLLSTEIENIRYEMPYWLYLLRLRERESFWIYRVSKKRIPDNQNAIVKRYINQFTQPFKKNAEWQKITALHNHIALDFNYLSDEDYFKEIDTKLAKVGSRMQDNEIREISRYALYAKMLYHLEIPFNTLYHFDNRVNIPDSTNLGNLLYNDFSFLIQPQGQLTVLHPKRAQLGFFANELPYFWEYNKSLIFVLEEYFDDIFPSPEFLPEIPADSAKFNYRFTNFRVEPRGATYEIEGVVSLSGQFSTVTRHNYFFQDFPEVLPPYFWQTTPEAFLVQNLRFKSTKSQKNYPFTHNFDFLGQISKENLWELKLPLAIPEFNLDLKRYTPFYFDFIGKDEYKFTLPKSSEYGLNNAFTSVNVQNPFFNFSVEPSETEENLVVTVIFNVKKSRVPASEFHHLISLKQKIAGFEMLLSDYLENYR
jgi:hypothetical protein